MTIVCCWRSWYNWFLAWTSSRKRGMFFQWTWYTPKSKSPKNHSIFNGEHDDQPWDFWIGHFQTNPISSEAKIPILVKLWEVCDPWEALVLLWYRSQRGVRRPSGPSGIPIFFFRQISWELHFLGVEEPWFIHVTSRFSQWISTTSGLFCEPKDGGQSPKMGGDDVTLACCSLWR